MTQVVVLAGGLGTRLGKLGRDRPKVLQEVGGRPFLDHFVAPFARAGVRRFHFCLGHLGEQVQEHLVRFDGLAITSRIDPPRGTAGALRSSIDFLDETFLVALGDTYLDVDIAGIADRLDAVAEGVMLVTSAWSDVPSNVAVHEGLVSRYDKGASAGCDYVDTGVIMLRRRALARIADTHDSIDLSVLFGRMIAAGALRAAVTDQRFYDIGTPERQVVFADFLAARRAGPSEVLT